MDIFVSYRRGTGDTPNAGRIRDYLDSLGFEVFHDQDEIANPTGVRFPESIACALASCRVIVAVIGRSWMEQIGRIKDSSDWVRAELLYACPGKGREFLPIYIDTMPSDLAGRLPGDLYFVQETNSHLIWRRFEDPEKTQLAERLDPALAAAPIRPERLRMACANRLPDSISQIVQNKYLPELYVHRHAEENIAAFRAIPRQHREVVDRSLTLLERIHRQFGLLPIDVPTLNEIGQSLRSAASLHDARNAMGKLRSGFLFNETEEVLRSIDAAVSADAASFAKCLALAKRTLQSVSALSPTALADVDDTLLELHRRWLATQSLSKDKEHLKSILSLLPSTEENNDIVLANDIMKQLQRSLERLDHCCLAIVDRAGRGKTNVIAHWSSILVDEHPVVFLGGRTIAAMGAEALLEKWFEAELPRQFKHWLSRLTAGLRIDDGWMYVMIDGINEARDPMALAKELADFLERIHGRRIRLIVTCRDIYWGAFAHHLEFFLFGERPIELGDFGPSERAAAIDLYFDAFRIKADLSEVARVTLGHPLLLRLFCDSNKGGDLGRVEALRNTKIFDYYIQTSVREVADQLRLVTPRPVEDLLLCIARRAWDSRHPYVTLASVGLTVADTAELGSIYLNLLAQGILRKEPGSVSDRDERVGFVFDEVTEYFIARAWFQDPQLGANPKEVLADIVSTVANNVGLYPSGLGALLYLDQMTGRAGELANDFLDRIYDRGDEVLYASRYGLLQVMERFNAGTLSDRALLLIARFEKCVSADVRQRIGFLIVELLKLRRDHPAVSDLLSRLLEVDVPLPGGTTLPPEPLSSMTSEDLIYRLPPLRFHYTTDLRLNAISLLVCGTASDREVGRQAMEKLGRVELSAALRAVEAVEWAEDDAVLSLVPSYVSESAPEYRLYAAWLLRERRGPAPSALLVDLLLDRSGRVREFTRRLLRKRRADPGLVAALLNRLRLADDLPPWSSVLLIDTLGFSATKGSFTDSQGAIVADGLLEQLAKHRTLVLRVQAGRALSAWHFALQDRHIERLTQLDDEVSRRLLQRLKRWREPS